MLRCPLIPGFNDHDDHLRNIAALASEISSVMRIDIEPYHPLGASKAERIGRTYALPELSFPSDAAVAEWIRKIQAGTNKPVRRA